MFAIGERVTFKEDGAIGTIVLTKEYKYLIAWEDYVLSWATIEQIQSTNTFIFTKNYGKEHSTS